MKYILKIFFNAITNTYKHAKINNKKVSIIDLIKYRKYLFDWEKDRIKFINTDIYVNYWATKKTGREVYHAICYKCESISKFDKMIVKNAKILKCKNKYCKSKIKIGYTCDFTENHVTGEGMEVFVKGYR